MSMHIAPKKLGTFSADQTIITSTWKRLPSARYEILGLLAKGYLYKGNRRSSRHQPEHCAGALHAVYEKLHVQSRTQAVVKFLGRE